MMDTKAGKNYSIYRDGEVVDFGQYVGFSLTKEQAGVEFAEILTRKYKHGTAFEIKETENFETLDAAIYCGKCRKFNCKHSRGLWDRLENGEFDYVF